MMILKLQGITAIGTLNMIILFISHSLCYDSNYLKHENVYNLRCYNHIHPYLLSLFILFYGTIVLASHGVITICTLNMIVLILLAQHTLASHHTYLTLFYTILDLKSTSCKNWHKKDIHKYLKNIHSPNICDS